MVKGKYFTNLTTFYMQKKIKNEKVFYFKTNRVLKIFYSETKTKCKQK